MSHRKCVQTCTGGNPSVETRNFMVISPSCTFRSGCLGRCCHVMGHRSGSKCHWAAWRLSDGWRSINCDISWPETIAMELAVLWVLAAGIHDVKVVIHGDNMGVLGTLNKGRSRNAASNLSICWMALAMALANILVDPVYVTLEM